MGHGPPTGTKKGTVIRAWAVGKRRKLRICGALHSKISEIAWRSHEGSPEHILLKITCIFLEDFAFRCA
jgi:hypothetical protein